MTGVSYRPSSTMLVAALCLVAACLVEIWTQHVIPAAWTRLAVATIMIPAFLWFAVHPGGSLWCSPSDRVLLVVAHPDDETMFFSPTILSLRARSIPTFVLCLSNGEAVVGGDHAAFYLRYSYNTHGLPTAHPNSMSPSKNGVA